MTIYIPPELLPNILARLPVDDVLRCTSVCKSWNSLITSPSFAAQHLKLASPNQEPRLLVEYFKHEVNDAVYTMHRDNQTFDEIAVFEDPPNHPNWDKTISYWEIIDSINGVVCLFDSSQGKVMLWNPSLRKSLILPDPRVMLIEDGPYDRTIGFGFIATTNEYKILWYNWSHRTGPEAEIYQLSTSSWHHVELLDDSIVRHLASPQAHLKGILHWYRACNVEVIDPISVAMICSFDLEKEEFGTVMMPNCRLDDDADFRVCTFRESLCLIEHTGYTFRYFCNIYVMKNYGVADSWEKLFIIDIEKHCLSGFLNFRHNGEILFENDDSDYLIGKTELISYDCKNNQVKKPGSTEFGPVYSVHTYVDSLALMKSANDAAISNNMYETELEELELERKLKLDDE